MKKFTLLKKRILKENGCKANYYSYGYDGICGSRMVLLLRLRGRRIYITPVQFLEARREWPDVWLYDDTGVVERMRWVDFIRVMSWGGKYEVVIGGGRRGRKICVQVDEDLWRLWQEKKELLGLTDYDLIGSAVAP